LRLPVSPEELRRRFPSLTDEELGAWSEVTRRLLSDPGRRGARLAEVLGAARRAEEKETAASPLDTEETLALCYVRALARMQGR